MNHGDVARGEVLTVIQLRRILPTMLAVTYGYRDHRARYRTASHWVRARSDLGERLSSNPRKIAVIHDRNGGGVSRLVMSADFRLQPSSRPGPTVSPQP
jgi:hypothetical protein